MNKILFLQFLLLLITGISCRSIKKVGIKNNISINIPKQAEPISQEQLTAQIGTNAVLFSTMSQRYIVNGIAIGVNELKRSEIPNDVTFESIKNDRGVFRYAGYKVNKVWDEPYNNITFLIFDCEKEGIGYYYF